jgi:hypothetical protein
MTAITFKDILKATDTHPRGWFDRLPTKQQKDLTQVREEYRKAVAEGSAPPAESFAKGLKKVCTDLPLPSPRSLAEWLRRET